MLTPPLLRFLTWLEATPLAIFVSQSPWGFSAIEMVHVAAISVVFGMITVLDLRLMGLFSIRCSVTDVYREAVPVIWGAFAVAACSGVLMFTGQAVKYYGNDAFRLKMALLVLAALNMLAFRFIVLRDVAAWDRGGAIPLASRLGGALSLMCWIAIVASARWIGYFML